MIAPPWCWDQGAWRTIRLFAVEPPDPDRGYPNNQKNEDVK